MGLRPANRCSTNTRSSRQVALFMTLLKGSSWEGKRKNERSCGKQRNQGIKINKLMSYWWWKLFYYILCVGISVIKRWIKMIPVKWYDIISLSEMISYHFTGLNCPIKSIVIIWLDQSGCTSYFSWRLASNLAGRIALQFYQRFLVLQLGGLIVFKHVICNKQIVTS